MDSANDIVVQASNYAKIAHGDHKRKWTGEPYWNHLHEVAEHLRKYGATPDLIAAGYLHDTLEDTKITYQELCLTFGHIIANLVIEVTDVSRPDSGNTPEGIGNRALRKAIDRQFLAGASWRGQMLKCADMLSNTKDVVANGKGFARIYVPEKKALIQVLDKVREYKYPIWRACFDSVVAAEVELERRASA